MRRFIFVLALSVFSTWAPARSQSCESAYTTLRVNENCFEYAKAANPAAYVSFPNRTCILYGICNITTANETRREVERSFDACAFPTNGTVSVLESNAAITVKTSTMPFSKRCPKYMVMRPRAKFLLLRTHASFGKSPYDLLLRGPVSERQLSVAEVKKEGAKPFKSPALAVANISSLKEVHIETLNDKGKPILKLGFAFRPGDKLEEGQWFAKNRLISVYPWNLRRVRSRDYTTFSIHGTRNRATIRRFEIAMYDARKGCSTYYGMLHVVEKASCPWETNNRYFPAYLHINRRFANWRLSKTEATEFRIFGVFNTKATVFARKSQTC